LLEEEEAQEEEEEEDEEVEEEEEVDWPPRSKCISTVAAARGRGGKGAVCLTPRLPTGSSSSKGKRNAPLSPPPSAQSARRRGEAREGGELLRKKRGTTTLSPSSPPLPSPKTTSRWQRSSPPSPTPPSSSFPFPFRLGTRGRALLREFKAALSSELEGEIVKATRPDNRQIKLKHLEPLLAITYQTPAQLDPFLPILRKLWAKMREGDSRITLKALYILHRFAANGAPEQASNLQARLGELSRQADSRASSSSSSSLPSSQHTKYFDTSAMSTEGRSFVSAYANYVIFRALHFGPGFPEVGREVGAVVGGEGGGEEGSADAAAAAAAAAAAMAEGRVLPPPVVWGGGDFDLLLRQVEGLLERAWEVRLGMEEEVSELSCACVEAVYFDLQQLLECLAGHLRAGLRKVGSEEGLGRVGRAVGVYEGGVGGLNEYVGRHKSLVEGQGVVMVPMVVVSLGAPPRVPSIEMVGSGGEEGEEEEEGGEEGKRRVLVVESEEEEEQGEVRKVGKKLKKKKMKKGEGEREVQMKRKIKKKGGVEEEDGKACGKKKGISTSKKKSGKLLTNEQPAARVAPPTGKKLKKKKMEKE